GFTDITGAQNSIDIENLARFAVDEHNKKENAVLEFVRVKSAKKQVVSG
nr:RecName: Full=Cystatin; AltName: Full=Low molecular mass protein inhibitor of cysteine proteinases [Glycine max]